MCDITPLPSPIFSEDPSGAWRKERARRHGSAGSLRSLMENAPVKDFSPETPSNPASRSSSLAKKKKQYPTLTPNLAESASKSQYRAHDKSHARVKSLGESATEPLHNVRPRNSTLSSMTPASSNLSQLSDDHPLHREAHLAEQRGFVHPPHAPKHAPSTAPLPTPPPSNRSINDSDGDEIMRDDETTSTPAVMLTVNDQFTKRTTKYKQIKPLGQGTFSKVVLATKQVLPPGFQLNEKSETQLDPKKLAAVKIVEHGPAGGADEERMELSLRREVEIMRSITHPSLIDLRGYSINQDDSLLVLGYCPGGDLFELASENPTYLKPKLVQRIFAEMVSALQHLHSKNIVHRDVKLESEYISISILCHVPC